MAARKPKFKVYRDARGKWRWRVTGENGLIVAASSQGFHDTKNCRANAKLTLSLLKHFFPGVR